MTHRGFSGHPARQDPEVETVFRTMRTNVNLVSKLEGRLSEENFTKLKASALGLMFVYSELTGLPQPDLVVGEVFENVVNKKQ
jgi:hypothetical protein